MPKVNKAHKKRNPLALSAILRKGGVHEKSRKAKRQKQKDELRQTVSKVMATYRGHSFVRDLSIRCYSLLLNVYLGSNVSRKW